MKLLKSSYKKITKEKNCENIPYLEMAEKKLVHCNITDNDYQQSQNSCIYLFQINYLGNWLRFYGKILYFQRPLISYIEVWFAGQNSKPLEIQDKINITLAIN